MAYQLNTAKDSRGDEHLFMDQFQKRLPDILRYKREHGGDLEGAFQQVTGTPWPAGRSVKMNDGQPEMTKDRSVGSVLGKYVAPAGLAALAAFAPAALPAAGKALFGGAKALGGARLLGMVPGAVQAVQNPSVANVAGVYGGSGLPGSGVADVFKGLGGDINKATEQSAQNRDAEQRAAMFGVNADAQAMKNMGVASYIASGGGSTRPQHDPLAGFGFDYKPQQRQVAAPPAAQQAFAAAMRDALLKKQANGEQLTMSGIQEPGTLEKIGQWAGPGMNMWGTVQDYLNGRRRQPTPPSAGNYQVNVPEA